MITPDLPRPGPSVVRAASSPAPAAAAPFDRSFEEVLAVGPVAANGGSAGAAVLSRGPDPELASLLDATARPTDTAADAGDEGVADPLGGGAEIAPAIEALDVAAVAEVAASEVESVAASAALTFEDVPAMPVVVAPAVATGVPAGSPVTVETSASTLANQAEKLAVEGEADRDSDGAPRSPAGDRAADLVPGVANAFGAPASGSRPEVAVHDGASGEIIGEDGATSARAGAAPSIARDAGVERSASPMVEAGQVPAPSARVAVSTYAENRAALSPAGAEATPPSLDPVVVAAPVTEPLPAPTAGVAPVAVADIADEAVEGVPEIAVPSSGASVEASATVRPNVEVVPVAASDAASEAAIAAPRAPDVEPASPASDADIVRAVPSVAPAVAAAAPVAARAEESSEPEAGPADAASAVSAPVVAAPSTGAQGQPSKPIPDAGPTSEALPLEVADRRKPVARGAVVAERAVAVAQPAAAPAPIADPQAATAASSPDPASAEAVDAPEGESDPSIAAPAAAPAPTAAGMSALATARGMEAVTGFQAGALQAGGAEWRLADAQALGAGVERGSQPAVAAAPREVAGQITLAVMQAEQPQVEIRLDPPELGRVQIRLNPTEGGGIQAVVLAERPETQDFLRRHADTLARDLGEAGYTDVTLEFAAGSDAGDRNSAPDERRYGRGYDAAPSIAPLAASPRRSATGGLDIRL